MHFEAFTVRVNRPSNGSMLYKYLKNVLNALKKNDYSKYCDLSGLFYLMKGKLSLPSVMNQISVVSSVCVIAAFCSQSMFASGLLWDENDLSVWRDRAINGPYKTLGDSFDSLVPGEWNRIVSDKNAFMSNPTTDREPVLEIPDNGVYRGSQDMVAAAFYSLVQSDSTIASTVKAEILWHARASGTQVSPTQSIITDQGNWWKASWLLRFLISADFVKEHFSASELAEVKGWLSQWAHAYESSVHEELNNVWPNRYNRDYTNPGFATTSAGYSVYAYQDSNGVMHNRIPASARYYNNRRSTIMQVVGLIAVWMEDATLMDRAKLYVEEWLQFSVFPDGSVGEYERNKLSGNIQQGMIYNAANLEACISIASALSRRGDHSLFEFSTRNGRWGTESVGSEPDKNLKMAVYAHMDLIEHERDWYFDRGSVIDDHRIDSTSETGSNVGYQWVGEIYFAPMGNRYWKDERIKRGYMRTATNSVAYFSKFGTAGPLGGPWGGHQAAFPSMLFMFAEMENVGTGPVTPPVTPPVEPPATDGLLSSTQWQNRSIELQSGQFSAEYDVVPNVSNMNGTTGLSFANASTWDDLAVIVGFSEAGQLNVRNGAVYSADAVVPYSAGTSYHFRIVGDLASHTYSVYVTEEAGTEIRLANNYAFRSSQAAVSSLDNLAVVAVTGSHTVSNFTISESVAVDTLAPTVPAGLSTSVVSMTQINLTWTASSDAVGVEGYKIYRDGTEIGSTESTSYSDVGLIASSSYAYSLSAYDAAGNQSSQSAVVTATTEPEVDADNLPDGWEIQYFGGINAVNGSEAEDFDGDGISNYDEWQAGTDPSNVNDFPVVKPPVTDGLLSNTQWQNRSIELQSGQFSAEYDVVPNISNMNGTTGLSFGNASTWDDLAVIVGFSEAGVINVRNGGVYSADTVVSYAAGTSYHVRIVGDMVSHTYSVYVAEGAGGEALLAENYAFRTSQSSVSGLDNLALFAVTGSHTVSNFTISESVAVDTIAPTVPAGLSASVASMTQINLTWTASSDAVGVAGYKIYREGAEIANTDTSSYSDVGLSASSSYAYSLSAYDAAGNHSSQSAVVTATTAPEVDADNLPDDWEIQYFGGISVVNGGEMEDFDGDGSSNYDEWFVGTDPTNPNDLLELKPVIGVSWIGVSNRSYEIEYSDDNWKTFITSDALIGSGEEMVWIDPSESNVIHKRQYRIQVVQQ